MLEVEHVTGADEELIPNKLTFLGGFSISPAPLIFGICLATDYIEPPKLEIRDNTLYISYDILK